MIMLHLIYVFIRSRNLDLQLLQWFTCFVAVCAHIYIKVVVENTSSIFLNINFEEFMAAFSHVILSLVSVMLEVVEGVCFVSGEWSYQVVCECMWCLLPEILGLSDGSMTWNHLLVNIVI